MSSRRPHLDVAERFRSLLEGTGLTRAGFVAALDGAVSARSLYAVLCGARRPSRSFALLIERTWGFRANYLLDGESPAWTRAEPIGPGVVAVELSQAESAVIKFMRTSVENSRTLLAELDHARVWSRLFERTLALVRALDVCGASTDEADRRVYPILAKVIHEECRFMGRQYRLLVSLLHRRRQHKLSDGFLDRFVGDVPLGALPAAYRDDVTAMLAPVQARRRQRLDEIESAIDRLLTTLDNLCQLDLPVQRVREHLDDGGARLRLERFRRLCERAGPSADLRALLAELSADPNATYRERLKRLLRDLVKDLDEAVPNTEALSLEKLRARYASLLDPLGA